MRWDSSAYDYPPFTYRRSSPPPITYYPSRPDPYLEALAEEQAAAAELRREYNALWNQPPRREHELYMNQMQDEREALQYQLRREAQRRQFEERDWARAQEQARREMWPQSQGQCFQPFFGSPGNHTCDPYDEELYEKDQYNSNGAPFEPCWVPRHPLMRPQWTQENQRTENVSTSFHPRSYTRPNPNNESSGEDLFIPPVPIPVTSPHQNGSKPLESHEPELDNTDAKAKSLSTIEDIRIRFHNILQAFTFQSKLEFDPKTTGEKPKLTYAKSNAPIHGYEDALVRLQQELDAVESYGDEDVIKGRKELVKSIEAELARIDGEIMKLWKEASSTSAMTGGVSEATRSW